MIMAHDVVNFNTASPGLKTGLFEPSVSMVNLLAEVQPTARAAEAASGLADCRLLADVGRS